MADKLKITLALLIVAGAIAAFYVFDDQSLLLRVTGLVVALGLAAAIAVQARAGADALNFARGAVIEARKVVWPSGKETSQTTLVVMAMVILMGIILWVFDMFLGWAVKLLTGQGG